MNRRSATYRSRGGDAVPDAVAEVRAVYDELAALPVERDCVLRAGCCHFRRTGLVPRLTAGEALVLARGLKASGRRVLPRHPDGACPLLDPASGRCMAYEARPFGCRTHYCEAAGGPLARRDVIDLIRRLERLDAVLGGGGARALPQAVEEAMERWC